MFEADTMGEKERRDKGRLVMKTRKSSQTKFL